MEEKNHGKGRLLKRCCWVSTARGHRPGDSWKGVMEGELCAICGSTPASVFTVDHDDVDKWRVLCQVYKVYYATRLVCLLIMHVETWQ